MGGWGGAWRLRWTAPCLHGASVLLGEGVNIQSFIQKWFHVLNIQLFPRYGPNPSQVGQCLYNSNMTTHIIWHNKLNWISLKYMFWVTWTIHLFPVSVQKFSFLHSSICRSICLEFFSFLPNLQVLSQILYTVRNVLSAIQLRADSLPPLQVHGIAFAPPSGHFLCSALYDRQLRISLGFPAGLLDPRRQGRCPSCLYWFYYLYLL